MKIWNLVALPLIAVPLTCAADVYFYKDKYITMVVTGSSEAAAKRTLQNNGQDVSKRILVHSCKGASGGFVLIEANIGDRSEFFFACGLGNNSRREMFRGVVRYCASKYFGCDESFVTYVVTGYDDSQDLTKKEAYSSSYRALGRNTNYCEMGVGQRPPEECFQNSK